MLVFILLLVIAAMALGILGVAVKGLLYLLFTGIGLLIVAFFIGALWMRHRTRRRQRRAR
jgi:TctA family transporter